MIRMAILALFLLLAGCGTQDPRLESAKMEEAPSMEELTEIQDQQRLEELEQIRANMEPDTLVLGATNPVGLHPFSHMDYSLYQVMKLFYDGLFRLDKDLRPVPHLVENYSFSADYRILTLDLRPDVAFHDGTPLRASDVVYSYELMRSNPANPYYGKALEKVASYAAIGERQVRITYSQPNYLGLYYLHYPIVSRSYMTDARRYNPMVPMGTGPYRMVSFQRHQSMELEANEAWFPGSPKLKKIRVRIFRHPEQAMTAFSGNAVDLVFPQTYVWYDYSEDSSQEMVEYPSNRYKMLLVNQGNRYLADPAFRRVLSRSIPREDMAKDIYLDHSVPQEYPGTPGGWLFKGTLGEVRQQEQSLAREDPPFDTSLVPQGQSFTLLAKSGDKTMELEALALQAHFKELGYTLLVRFLGEAEHAAALQARSYDLALVEGKYADGPEYKDLFGTGGRYNRTGYSSPVLDNALDRMDRSAGEDAFKAAYVDFSVSFQREVPAIMLYSINNPIIYKSFVQGEISPNPMHALDGLPGVELRKLP
ncbi:ABC transporter substrate-binding protein [Anaerotalea alkaliphila]|uniref:ABC transporter substrate-binding protein n=1 Tax=Anaerotalea alkaliphila TaxID=2662126 RepID=A0A7X5KN96_9FIRM|nr:ABC transporter substrate-binding protein [Anaerotalea alkaliphila]NDL68629.1 ABC transporter substrate-binding protein [Anaerotalea alkaliphila]